MHVFDALVHFAGAAIAPSVRAKVSATKMTNNTRDFMKHLLQPLKTGLFYNKNNGVAKLIEVVS
ncbi:MAG: hypothetical protein LBV29_04105, partial [Azoarcus sp.]|nr:hypothetical protein [Azoarcus sp.]